ncbi:MAG: AAA family ATPase [Pirellulales bacterium]
MTAFAIGSAFKTLGRSDVPQIFSYEVPAGAAIVGDIRAWDLVPLPIDDINETKQRLRVAGSDSTMFDYPDLSADFRSALSPNGVFEESTSKQEHMAFQVPQCPDIVVFHDLCVFLRYLTIPACADPDTELAAALTAGKTSSPREVLQLALASLMCRLRVAQDKSESHRFFRCMEPVIVCPVRGDVDSLFTDSGATLWNTLRNDPWLRERTVLLLDASDLRTSRDALAISTGLSWERTAQDTIFELRRNANYRRLLDFGQVVVRYGVTGALHIARRGDRDWSYALHFDPAHHDRAWTDPDGNGIVLGCGSVFTATIVQMLTKKCYEQEELPSIADLQASISEALPQCLLRCQALFHASYGHTVQDAAVLSKINWLPNDLYSRSVATTTPFSIAKAEVPPVQLRSWSILSQSAQTRIGRVARDIVRTGVDKTLNQQTVAGEDDDTVIAPVLVFGKVSETGKDERIIVVDRREIEGFRAIQKLIESHIESTKEGKNTRPLSLAVFGPPGAGKSFAVKAIIKNIGGIHNKLKILDPYNVAQFSDISSLNAAFAEVSRSSLEQTPVAFFDEFDCASEEEELGWLKLFLAPMEDGVFLGNSVKTAILVFAGGTSATFASFSLEGRSSSDAQWLAFSKAKGPDFVSRLRGHLNIVGVNPADPEDELYLIRRAIMVRSVLSQLQDLGPTDVAQIDRHMLRAVLHVPEYRHGGRAVRTLLQSCQSNSGAISVSAVPPTHQLNMLVDGKAFLDLMMNVSSE